MINYPLMNLFFVLFFISKSLRKICICNGECPLNCPNEKYSSKSQQLDLNDYFQNQIKNIKEIEIDLYSNNENFLVKIDLNLFSDKTITLKALPNSCLVTIKYEHKQLTKNKIITIKPDYQLNVPDFVPIKTINPNHSKIIKENSTPMPTPETIPISLGIKDMTVTGDYTNTSTACPGENNGQISNSNVNDPANYQCGTLCHIRSGSISVKFTGVQFALIGTYGPGLGLFDISIDGQTLPQINSHSSNRQPYKLLYTSDELEYGQHTVTMTPVGGFELYKLVFWPSTIAKRINMTDFTTKLDWKSQSDNIGGVRWYKDNKYNGEIARTRIRCSKFWIYGTECKWHGSCEFQFGTLSGSFNEFHDYGEGVRKDFVMLYESDNFDVTSNEFIFKKSSATITINCIFYIEYDPPQIPAAVGVSIGIDQMTISGSHSNQTIQQCPSSDNDAKLSKDNLKEPYNYQCGIVTRMNSGSLSYTFLGVRFEIIGTIDPELGSFDVFVDGEKKARVNSNGQRNTFSHLYKSSDLEYGSHTVMMQSIDGNKFEIHKLVFWPSLFAKRINITDFSDFSGWTFQTDTIGGVRAYKPANQNMLAKTKIHCKKFWIYGTKCQWHGNFFIDFGPYTVQVNEYEDFGAGVRKDFVMLHESPVLYMHEGDFIIRKSSNTITINYVYYLENDFPNPTPVPTPAPTPTTIPIAVNIAQMQRTGNDFTCNSNTVSLDKIGTLNCKTDDLASPEVIHCGFVCNTSTGSFTYTFKGVQFVIYGSYGPDYRKMSISIDGELFEADVHRETKEDYALLFTSNLLPYKEHTVIISGKNNQKIELFRLAYWPSVRAKRLNSTEFMITNGNWKNESDGSGGIRIYSDDGNNEFHKIQKNIRSSKIWVYGKKCSWHYSDNDFSFGNVLTGKINANQGTEEDGVILYESPYLFDKEATLSFSNNGKHVLMIHCIYYIEEPVPISVGLYQMDVEGSVNCNYDLSTNPQHINCPNESIDVTSESSYNCGFVCWSNFGVFKYTFTGIKFDLYGTYSSNYVGFDIIVDDNPPQTVNEYKITQEKYSLIYTSQEYEYGNHTVVIKGKGRPFELYKLVYWPSFKARRLNTTDLQFPTGTWKKESDGIGGIREYSSSAGKATKEITSSRIWLFGTEASWHSSATLSFGVVSQTISQSINHGNGISKSGLLLFDSSDIPFVTDVLTIITNGVFMIQCIFYIDEPADPFPSPVATPSQSETPFFSQSVQFSNSLKFSQSNDFTNSHMFSGSTPFTHSVQFSNSLKFSQSNDFSKTDKFSLSNSFSKSDEFPSTSYFSSSIAFTGTDQFSKTSGFTHTGQFSDSKDFSESSKFLQSSSFSDSKQFSSSLKFSDSKQFSQTNEFTKTGLFSYSNKFSDSSMFSQSNKFTMSNQFSGTVQFSLSDEFSNSDKFSQSKKFSESVVFSESEKFSNSVPFSFSNEFDPSAQFSSSQKFSNSELFSQTNEFSQTGQFSHSSEFSNSKQFSQSKKFSNSEQFSSSQKFSNSELFSQTNEFSKTEQFSYSNEFSNSKQFSQSNKFSGSKSFSETNEFSNSISFSKSSKFSLSGEFSMTNDFSNSFYFSQSKKFSQSGSFSISKHFSESSEFSHTDKFSETNFFSFTNQFTLSKGFSNSNPFSKSNEFSNSGKFSHTDHFSLTNDFTLTTKFTISNIFSDSKNFTQSLDFSNTKYFTGTNKFSYTSFFTRTKEFTLTEYFTRTSEFTSTAHFSGSSKFSDTFEFTRTSKFSYSKEFSQTTMFSESEAFSESQAFSPSPSLPPLDNPVCNVISDNQEITLSKRCDFSDFSGNKTSIKIICSNFTDYVESDDGAAIRIINCEFECNNTVFINCSSTNGGGGAIYINNSFVDNDNNITLEYLAFIRCCSNYGGAVFIYAPSDFCHVLVNSCNFSLNQAKGSKRDDDLYGGSSMFLSAKNSNIIESKFEYGIGKGGSLKIVDTDRFMNGRLKMQSENELGNVLISGCVFEKDENDDNSIFYVAGNAKNDVDVVECNFKGKVSDDSRYIDGKSINKKHPNFRIISCNFEHSMNYSVNMKLIKESTSNNIMRHDKVKLNMNLVSIQLFNKNVIIFSIVIAVLILGIHIIKNSAKNDDDFHVINNVDDSYESQKTNLYNC